MKTEKEIRDALKAEEMRIEPFSDVYDVFYMDRVKQNNAWKACLKWVLDD